VQKWVDNKWLVVLEGFDDLYWMYATVRACVRDSRGQANGGKERNRQKYK